MDGAVTRDIIGLRIASSRKWKDYIDIGQGDLNTLVYPVLVEWNQTTFYRTRNAGHRSRGTFHLFRRQIQPVAMRHCCRPAEGREDPEHQGDALIC